MNIKTAVEALDPVTNLRIETNCSSTVLIHEWCLLQAAMDAGQQLSYVWLVSGPLGTHNFTEESFVLQLPVAGDVKLRLNVTNRISSEETSALIRVVLFFPSSSIQSPRPSATTNQPISSMLAPSPTILPNSRSIEGLNISRAELSPLAPPFAAVGQTLLFAVVNVPAAGLRFSWDWGDTVTSHTGKPTANHTYSAPGLYYYLVKVVAFSSHVTLRGHVTIQFPVTGVRLEQLSFPDPEDACVSFRIGQGTNASYSVDFGDDAGEKLRDCCSVG